MIARHFIAVLLLFQVAAGHPVHRKESASAKLHSTIKADGSYAFHAGADPSNFYLTNSEPFLQSDGTLYSMADGSLKMSGSKTISGSDATGTYEGMVYSYKAGGVAMEAQVLVYNGGEFIRFTQSFPDGLKNCNVSNTEGVLSSFPSFKIGMQNSTKSLGFLNSYGDMFGYGYKVGSIEKYQSLIAGGGRSGPLLLFDTKGSVMIVSSYSNFMAHYMQYSTKTGIADYGVMGAVTELPVDFQIDTILYYGSEGINRAVEGWGRVLTRRYHKMRHTMESDFTVNYLGYWTDNGAFYYYNTEKGKNYEDTIKDVVSYARENDIPYGYIQYDSWWYYKGIGDGVKNWTSMPSIFPNGMDALFDSHGLPVSAHNRYWAADTTYAKQNGGKYDFFVETSKAIPYDTHFWKDLMRSSKTWGLVTYEQDWLDREFDDLMVTHTNVTLARDWLMEMGAAAGECDLTIQYCMGLPRHMMQSVEIQAVTQARVSGDYHPGNTQWKLGVTSMFAHALYIAPYKDTFWTTTSQEGSPYGSDSEPNTHLQSAISTLSTGPVGPSDKIGEANIPLLMKCCRADGLILKPSRAITAIDDNILKRAFPSMNGMPNIDAEVYTTFSDVFAFTPAGKISMRFGIALAADLTTKDYSISLNDMYLTGANPEGTKYVAYQGFPGTDTKLYNLTGTDMLPLPTCGLKDFQLWHVSPLIMLNANTSVAILGEREKWVPVSSKRIRGVEFKGGNVLLDIVGRPGEMVKMDFLLAGKVNSVTCKLPTTGVSRISVKSMKCF